MNEQYEYGVCQNCGTMTWLNYGRCATCNAKEVEMPEFLKNIFSQS